MPFEIKNRFTGAVIFRSEEAPDIRAAVLECLELANKAGEEANLTWADLTRANLTEANLTRANLTGANLTRANLTGANLTEANLTRANLTWADLTRANLTEAKADLFSVLDNAPKEVPALLEAVRAGNIDGSTYEGECACLCGTIANIQGCSYRAIPNIVPDSDRAAERWFLAIRKGDTPETSQVAKITEGWIEEWLAGNIVGAA